MTRARRKDASRANATVGQPVRAVVATLLARLCAGDGSLATLCEPMQQTVDSSDRALLQELAYGTSRHFHTLEYLAAQLLQKPLRNKDRDIHCLILVGIYQLRYQRIAAHAAIDLTVESAEALRKPWAKGVINAVLRNYLRSQPDTDQAPVDSELDDATDVARFSHPQWMIERLRKDWKDDWQQILLAGSKRPPMVLRVNRLVISVENYLQKLNDLGMTSLQHPFVESAVVLDEPVAVNKLPGFDQGLVSVQDASAQLAGLFMAPELTQIPKQNESAPRVLDACAAPGGKTCHLLELGESAAVTALDISESRLLKATQNLQRLQLQERATQQVGDAADPETWWDGEQFDLILLDAPCSGSGIIRRQPDVKLLRRPQELPILANTQQKMLNSLWPLLKTGGKLLYVTCSVFRSENALLLESFVASCSDAREVSLQELIPHELPSRESLGVQLLSGEFGMDGFYFCLLEKLGD